MNDLTPRARAVLGYIDQFLDRHGYAPSLREIGADCGIPSTRSVSDDLKRLEHAGQIRRGGGRSRGIERVGRSHGDPGGAMGTRGVPVLGAIAAGAPLGAEAVADGHLPVDADRLYGHGDCFALRVRGDSMVERHIVSGDHVILRQSATAHPGEVVAVAIGTEVTLKVYREQPGTGAQPDRIILMPANSAYDPIVIGPEDAAADGGVRILGVMVGLIRQADPMP